MSKITNQKYFRPLHLTFRTSIFSVKRAIQRSSKVIESEPSITDVSIKKTWSLLRPFTIQVQIEGKIEIPKEKIDELKKELHKIRQNRQKASIKKEKGISE